MAIRLPPKRCAEPSHHAPEPVELLTVKEAAAFVCVSEVSIRRWIKARLLRCYRVGRQIRIPKADLIDFLRQY